MSARSADVQVYNINYLLNISSVVAAPYTPVQNVWQRQSVHAPPIFGSMVISLNCEPIVLPFDSAIWQHGEKEDKEKAIQKEVCPKAGC